MAKLSILFMLILMALVWPSQSAPRSRKSREASIPSEELPIRQSKLEEKYKEDVTTSAPEPTHRRNKALNLFGYFPPFMSSGLDYADDDDDVTFSVNDDSFDDEDLSRTIPSTRRQQQNKKKNGNANTYQNDNINSLQYDNSPIFYIRLPPTPYMFVPGLGYVSQPPSLGPSMSPLMPQGVPPQMADPFINLPLDFVSNGKPTGVYQWSGPSGYPSQMESVDPFGYGSSQAIMPPAPRPTYNTPTYTKPKPKPAPTNSKITNLKGQFVFNGKPGDSVYVLRDTYNSLYSDALQNFYP
ncbi:unnamed protein product [Parnassius mnemosyne]|uniref:Uncharacterized protein n=1 Tax=Parnassius mnemosyne TaxID=213953 RepID=A0AAV1LQ22_9NEOP